MTEELESYVSIVRAMIEKEKKYDEESIDKAIQNLKQIYSIDDETTEIIRKKMLT